ncbi:MAG: hypothetical protein EPN30_08845 [Actinomycetota bacterium]|nr:MAG: hypothetical protein EPN30_08845 [Actinomycetota bacterium]
MAKVGAAGTVAAAALLLTGCTGTSSATAAKDVSAVSPSVVHEQMVIQTGKMAGKPGWPKFVPSDLTFAAGSTVDLKIVNYDDGTAPVPPSSPYGHVWGSDPTFALVNGGSETVNGKAVTEVANNLVSHTLTVPGLLLNIPIPAVPSGQKSVTVEFTFQVLKAGRYFWQCEAPCGTGTTGFGGAMNSVGWMQGYFNVT